MQLYNKYSVYLKNKYGSKVYKLPVNLSVTCPNLDGSISNKGCIFCGEEGAGFESLPNTMGVREQILTNMQYIKENYNADKFIAYFQNYSNTYLPMNSFIDSIHQSLVEDVVAVYISTRPDCITDEQLIFLEEVKNQNNIDIVIELGLQTVNYRTLEFLNRGHTLAEFIDAVFRIKSKGIDACAHYIIDLPWDDMTDVVQGAKVISSLRVDQVKIHSLYILKDTVLGKMFESGELQPLSLDEYISRCITFLEYLSPNITIQRLTGRAPESRTLFCNWGISWRKLVDMIEDIMIRTGSCQGKKFDYLIPRIQKRR